jgi:hypothetical protein
MIRKFSGHAAKAIGHILSESRSAAQERRLI